MKLHFLKSVDSTQTYLKKYIKENSFSEPICFYTDLQTSGIGSRDNKWTGKKGNLFFSFVLPLSSLPEDLELVSSSIYFSYILKEVLANYGSCVWMKWPNDFYIDNKKIGGTITQMDKEYIYCGIGLNMIHVDEDFGFLDIQIQHKNLLEQYFFRLEKVISWKQIFSKFSVEFYRSKKFKTTINMDKKSLENAILLEDGSIELDGQKVFSLR